MIGNSLRELANKLRSIHFFTCTIPALVYIHRNGSVGGLRASEAVSMRCLSFWHEGDTTENDRESGAFVPEQSKLSGEIVEASDSV